jgi:hypothetical protein
MRRPTIIQSSRAIEIGGGPRWRLRRRPGERTRQAAPGAVAGGSAPGGDSACRCDRRDKGGAADGHRGQSTDPVGCRSGSEYHSQRPKRTRHYSRVPRELIEDCLRVAMQAPIGSNGLYPHFIVVTDPAKRTALAGFYKRAWDAYLPLLFRRPTSISTTQSTRRSSPVSPLLRPTWPNTWRTFPHW